MTSDVLRLPAYPSTQSRKALPASQRATLHQTIASTLSVVLALPPQKRDIPSTRAYLASYAQDTALQGLQALIWRDGAAEDGAGARSADEKAIARRSLLLAEKLAQSSPGLDIQTLLDLAVVYSRTQPASLRRLFTAAHQARPELASAVASELIPGLTALLAQQTPAARGLYAQRKVAACILAFLRGAKDTPALLRPFAHSKPFILALTALYDGGLTAIAASYGGLPALSVGIAGASRTADEWETIWVETKVALLDAFHIVLGALTAGLAVAVPGPALAAEAERAFDVVFALLEAPSASTTPGTTPFLDQPLLADYQQAYALSKTLAAALRHAHEKDARLDLLESALQAFDVPDPAKKQPGALKIVLRSSGIQPGIDNLGTRITRGPPPAPVSAPAPPVLHAHRGNVKGKSRATPPADDPDLDIKATQVLDILPDTPAEYVKRLLAHDRYGRNPESVIAALLEGTAMSEDELARDAAAADEDENENEDYHPAIATAVPAPSPYSISERRNVFDDEDIDLSRLRVGKVSAGAEILRDRTFIEEMKADILRRAEAVSDDEEEVDEADIFGGGGAAAAAGKGKAKAGAGGATRSADLGPEDEEDAVPLRLGGDGEDSGDDDDDEEEAEREEEQTPETVLELAYLRDPKLFDRDGATRRSKARTDLKAQTGWGDEQIEGWKIMLERNPIRKEKIAEKHAFRGNEKGLEVRPGGSSGGRGRGGPRGGRGRGGGGGRGGGSGGGGTGESSARERAWKDKNKASRGNHNRKRGHDKKMARAGAVAGPSS